MKYIFIVISFFALICNLHAQSIVHLCVGDADKNFSVPYHIGSSYTWTIVDNSNIAVISSGNGTEHIKIDLNNTGMFKLKVEEIDLNGCTSSDSIYIEVHPLPNPLITSFGSTNFCEGDSIKLEVDSMYSSNIWNNGFNGIFQYVYSSGNYYIEVQDTNGCTNISNVININTNPTPVAEFLINGLCAENPTFFIDVSTITSGSINNIFWYYANNLQETNMNTISHVYNTPGIYSTDLIVVSDAGCIDSISKDFTINPTPVAEFSFEPKSVSTLKPEVNFFNLSSDYVSVFWDFDDSNFSYEDNPIHSFQDAGVYNVQILITDSNSCVDSTSYSITSYYDFIIFAPNSFTPNDNGQNDKFILKGVKKKQFKYFELNIFNRWGELVFSTNDVNYGWDGGDSSSGTYKWIATITDEIGGVHKKNGEILLVR